MQMGQNGAIGLKRTFLPVLNRFLRKIFLNDAAGFSQTIPWHPRKQVMLDLIIQPPE
jgi:hypothetical protein